jgi:hypothetical protein
LKKIVFSRYYSPNITIFYKENWFIKIYIKISKKNNNIKIPISKIEKAIPRLKIYALLITA